MDERLVKALDISNYMVTLNNQRRSLKEKFMADLIFYQNGGSFSVSKELINFTKTLVDYDNDTDVVLIDDNNIPILIEDLKEFLSKIINIYFVASNEYYTEYEKLKKNRSVERITA